MSTTEEKKQSLNGGLIAALALLTAIGSFATDMYLPSLPTIVEEFGTRESLVQVSLTAYLVGSGVGQLIIGPISDAQGRKRLMVGSTIVSVFCSFLCALAPSIGVLIAARFILGLAGGGSTVLARSVVSDLATGKKAASAYSLLAMVQGVAPVTAPLVGGALAGPIGWRGVFCVLAAINIAQLLVAAFYIRESRPQSERTPGDLGQLARTFKHLGANRNFVAYAAVVTCAFSGLFAYVSASPFVFEVQFGLPVTTYTLIFALNSCALIISSFINSRLVRSFQPQTIMRVALVVMSICGAVELFAALFMPYLWIIIPGLFFFMSSASFIMGNANALGARAAGKFSGTGLAIMGCCQLVLGGLMSPVAGLGADHRLTMAIILLTCGLLALGASFLAKKDVVD
ncbi:MAG: multidrug effflux MFS transporter [Corynebacterium sp.]|nr:multidrug effflux MFS transporter [Corynebacterium sp.]